MTPKKLAAIAITALTTASLLLDARADITTGLVGYWKFDDGSGSPTAADSSGNNYNGTLTDFSDSTLASMWVAGRLGDALLFNSNGDTSDYVSVPDASGLDFGSTKAFTVAAWVNLSVAGGSQSNGACILCKGVTGTEQYSLDITGGQFRMLTRNSSGKSQQIVSSTITPSAGTWYHVAAIWSASPQQQYIYIDGTYNNTYSGSGFLTSAYSSSQVLSIGCAESSATSGYNLPFKGIIDDVHIYNRALAASDIYQLYTNGATIANAPGVSTQPRSVTNYAGDTALFVVAVNSSTTLLPVGYQWQWNGTNIAGATASSLVLTNVQPTNTGTYNVVITNFIGTNISSATLTVNPVPAANTNGGLVGWWKFDDASTNGTSPADSSTALDSINGNNGALTGFTDTTFENMWITGLFGGAIDFNLDGSGSNVVAIPSEGTPGPAALDFSANGAFSLAAWVNAPATNKTGAIFGRGTGGGGEEYVLELSGGYYRFFVRDTNATVWIAQSAVAPSGTWQHVAGVLNLTNGTMNLYVNGALAAYQIAPYSLLTNATTNTVNIGNRQAGSAINSYTIPFTGIIDDARIYNRALTSADIAALYAAAVAPLVVSWPSSAYDVVARANAKLAPTLSGGLPPYSYQWQQNGSNIPGATNYPLILNNAGSANAGSYDLILSDAPYVPAVTSSVVAVAIEPSLTFNTNGLTWTFQGSTTNSTWPGNNVLELTTGAINQSNSAFYTFPLLVGAFQASFTYRLPLGSQSGVTFCIQNDPRGPAAIGANAAELGVGNAGGGPGGVSITPSVEFEIILFPSDGVSFDVNGVIGPEVACAPVVFNTTDAYDTAVNYQSNVLTVTLTDTTAGTQFSISTNLNITNALGSAFGYVGFTGSSGAANSTQQIDNFLFQSLVDAPPSLITSPQPIANLPAGLAAVFSASAFGGIPLYYQWQLNGTNLTNGLSFTGSGATISGANTTNLTIAGALTADSGTYSVVVSNGYLPNASASAILTVTNVPQIISQTPSVVEVFAGSTPTLFMSVEGLGPFHYQWTSNGYAIAGATGSTYTVVGTQGTTTYGGTVSNAYGTNFISPVTLTVLPAPTNPYPAAVLASHPVDYWRLDESSGTVGYDYTGGNNGVYSNVLLNYPGYTSAFNPQTDPNETSAFFGNYGTNNNYMGSVPTLVNFATPTNTSAAFSVEAWINSEAGLPSGAGLVSIGYGGGEQFCLDLYTTTNVLRFFVRNAGGKVYSAQSTFAPANLGGWHHVVGVCDQANSSLYLYVDGLVVASNSLPAGSGLLASTQSLTMGARQGGLGTSFDDQFTGAIDDVALYNYALNATEVQTHYYAAGIAPANLQVQPTTLTTNQNSTATFTATVTGTPPLSYFWTDLNSDILVSTNPVLTLNNVQTSDNYQLLVSNAYGTANTSASLNVDSGPVYIVSDLSPLIIEVPPGSPVSFAVGVGGTAPFKYQWYINTNTPVPGATNAVYTFLASVGTNTYNVWVTNQSGGATASSSTVTVEVSGTPPVIGFGDGTSWSPNNGAAFSGSPAVLELTDGNPSETRSAFFNVPQYVEGFLASFTYTPAPGTTSTRADGATFTLQNSANGFSALGGAGGQLGYYGITPSVAFELDIYSGDAGGVGVNWETNGLTAGQGGVANGGTGSVNINSLDPIGVTLYYNYGKGQLDVNLVDQTTSVSYRTNYQVGDLGALLGGDLAYVGFTGGTGGSDSVQTIGNFAYSYSQTPVLSIGPGAGEKVIISWNAPTVSTNFVLQQSSVVSGPWSNVTTAPIIVSNQNQVSVSPAGSAQFYRLVLHNP
jgi:hypothetical protein